MSDALAFKGEIAPITILKIYTTDIDAIQVTLKEKKRGAPLMMVGMQVVIDMTDCESNEFNIHLIKRCLMDEGVMPVALMSKDFSHMAQCQKEKIGFIPPYERPQQPALEQSQANDIDRAKDTSETACDGNYQEVKRTEGYDSQPENDSYSENNKEHEIKSTELAQTPIENLIIYRQVRSGQRIYSRGDLIVVGSVSPGAEVIADGNIHVYGMLGGRAMAGANGDEEASIFCQKFEAELVSIAGFYVGAIDTDPQYHQAAVQISLNNEKIKFYRL